MRILNLYAGVGGNRKLWGGDIEVVAVEQSPEIAAVYHAFFPDDKIIIGDAHTYLLEHINGEFDFIWTSPPCPTHSRLGVQNQTVHRKYKYPDMRLYQEIIALDKHCDGKWCVENVIPYYKPLIEPTVTLSRHNFWANFDIPYKDFPRLYQGTLVKQKASELEEAYGFALPKEAKNKRLLLRNICRPDVGGYIFNCASERNEK